MLAGRPGEAKESLAKQIHKDLLNKGRGSYVGFNPRPLAGFTITSTFKLVGDCNDFLKFL